MEPSAGSSTSRSRWLRRLPYALVQPWALLSLAGAVHVAGRIAAALNPNKWDSLAYAVSADWVWRRGTPFYSLILDKPPGQQILTGWVFRVLPGPANRMMLAPIESLFLIAAYVIFWRLCRRFFERRLAAALTLLTVIAFNTYNALDTTTDGLALNENFLALPMWLAAWAHLGVESPLRRGLLAGLGLGLALSIKQSAVGLAAAMAIHGFIAAARRRAWRPAIRSTLATGAVLAVIGLALAGFLWARGWLHDYPATFLRLSWRRVGSVQLRRPEDYKLLPLTAFGWWALLGVIATLGHKSPSRNPDKRPAGRRSHTDFGMGMKPRSDGPSPRGSALEGGSPLTFAVLWFAAEAAILGTLQIPSTHYYQQVVAPAALLAGHGWQALMRGLAAASTRQRLEARRWVATTTAGLALLGAMPLLAAASKLLPTLDLAAEVRDFNDLDANWSKRADVAYDPEQRP
jgi:hypothetical protein